MKSEDYIHAVELYGGYVYEENFFNMLADEVKNIAYSGDKCDVKIKAYTFK